MRWTLFGVLVVCLLVSGCASRTWGKPGVRAVDGEWVLAACRDEAEDGSRVNMLVVGDPAMVAGAVIGSAIGHQLRYRQLFAECMAKHGYIEVE